MHTMRFGHSPWSSAVVCSVRCRVRFESECYETFIPSSWLLPLSPHYPSDFTPNPTIEITENAARLCYSKIICPASRERHYKFSDAIRYLIAPHLLSEASYLVLEALDSAPMYCYPLWSFPFREGEAQELTVPRIVHSTLLLVYFKLELFALLIP